MPYPTLSAAVGKALRQRRYDQGLTQRELAHKTHLRQATISAIENGEQSPTLETLLTLCNALGINIANIIPTQYQYQFKASPAKKTKGS